MAALFDVQANRALGMTVVYQGSGGRYAAHEAIMRAIGADDTGVVRIVGQAFRLDAPVRSSKGHLRIEMTPRTRMLASLDAAIGAFDLTGENVHIDGMGGASGGGAAIETDAFVAGQTLVRLGGHQSGIRGCKIIKSATAGDPATPQVGVRLLNSHMGYVAQNLFLPELGFSCVEVNALHANSASNPNGSDQAPSAVIVENLFTSHDPQGATTVPLAKKRRCYRGISVAGAGWGHIARNTFTHLGDYANTLGLGASYMDSAIIVQKGIDPTISLETGHWSIDDNLIEYCDLHRGIQAWSIPTALIRRNKLWRNEAATALGDAMIVVTGFLGSSFEATVGAGPSTLLPTSGIIDGNDFHNCWFHANATGILIEGSESLRVTNNHFSLINSGGIPIRLRGVTPVGSPFFIGSRSHNLLVQGNNFLSPSAAPAAVIVIDAQHELIGTQEFKNNTYSNNFAAFRSGTGTGTGTIQESANTTVAVS